MTKRIDDGLSNSQRYHSKHPEANEKDKMLKRKITHEQRLKIIELLGGKCSNPNCLVIGGCTDWRCLQIDHINGGGNKEIKQFQMDCTRFYKFVLAQIKAGSKDYQLLCANCNWIKRHERNEFRR